LNEKGRYIILHDWSTELSKFMYNHCDLVTHGTYRYWRNGIIFSFFKGWVCYC